MKVRPASPLKRDDLHPLPKTAKQPPSDSSAFTIVWDFAPALRADRRLEDALASPLPPPVGNEVRTLMSLPPENVRFECTFSKLPFIPKRMLALRAGKSGLSRRARPAKPKRRSRGEGGSKTVVQFRNKIAPPRQTPVNPPEVVDRPPPPIYPPP